MIEILSNRRNTARSGNFTKKLSKDLLDKAGTAIASHKNNTLGWTKHPGLIVTLYDRSNSDNFRVQTDMEVVLRGNKKRRFINLDVTD